MRTLLMLARWNRWRLATTVLVEHQTTLVKNLHVDKLITTDYPTQKRPESTKMQIKNWAAIFHL